MFQKRLPISASKYTVYTVPIYTYSIYIYSSTYSSHCSSIPYQYKAVPANIYSSTFSPYCPPYHINIKPNTTIDIPPATDTAPPYQPYRMKKARHKYYIFYVVADPCPVLIMQFFRIQFIKVMDLDLHVVVWNLNMLKR